jgi:hypothetical protein
MSFSREKSENFVAERFADLSQRRGKLSWSHHKLIP